LISSRLQITVLGPFLLPKNKEIAMLEEDIQIAAALGLTEFQDMGEPSTVLTLRDLAEMCDRFIEKGANPDNPVLVSSDPEGNSLNTLCNTFSLAKVDYENEWMPQAVDIPNSNKAEFRDAISLSDTHVVIFAFQEVSWDESQYESAWDQPVPFEVI
jgi:hypothetical protein